MKQTKTMKNIYVLPTDKPNRLYLFEERLILGDLVTVVFKNSGAVNQNIYITSDEEIKEGDYVINSAALYVFQHYFAEGNLYKECKKIILTTDQDLIKDGVQAIDDEFLEWFVNNPSCEDVEVDTYVHSTENASTILYGAIIPKEIGFKVENGKRTKTFYSKEEPKQDLEKEMFDLEQELDIPSNLRWHNSKPKQETLEEYDIKDNKIMLLEEDLECVNMYLDDLKLPRTDNKDNEYSIVGRIKRLQEIMYSEEDISIAIAMYLENKSFSEIIKQLKNK